MYVRLFILLFVLLLCKSVAYTKIVRTKHLSKVIKNSLLLLQVVVVVVLLAHFSQFN